MLFSVLRAFQMVIVTNYWINDVHQVIVLQMQFESNLHPLCRLFEYFLVFNATFVTSYRGGQFFIGDHWWKKPESP